MAPKIIEIKELNHADREASVKLVSIGGHKYVLKTDTKRDIAAQKYFNSQLEQHGLPALQAHVHATIKPNQILLEYVTDSLTLGSAPDEATCRQWGSLVARMHEVRTDTFTVLDGDDQIADANWSDYLQGYIDKAFSWHDQLRYQLSAETLQQIRGILGRLMEYRPEAYSLTHGDLHVHNVLIKDGELILFDKFADFLVAPPAFDLGVLYAEAFGGAAFPELGFSTRAQQSLFAAFLDGYGPLPAEQQEWLDYFILLRAFYRWPNRYAPHSGETIRLMAARLSAAG